MKNIVLYHEGCWDGFCAAWIFHRATQNADLVFKFDLAPETVYIPVRHGNKPPAEVMEGGNKIFILDFSYDKSTICRIAIENESVLILDHHVTAQQELTGSEKFWQTDDGKFPGNICIIFDMNKSGGRLTAEYFYGEMMWDLSYVEELLVRYTEDRDLWLWKMPNSKEFNAALRTYPLTFEFWDGFTSIVLDQMSKEGTGILRYQTEIVQQHVRNSRVIHFEGHRVPCVNCTFCISEVGEALHQSGPHPFSLTFFTKEDGKNVFSMRSPKGGVDVSVIAKRFGGGGHPNAAGFIDSFNPLYQGK